jgi:hypothetical protein
MKIFVTMGYVLPDINEEDDMQPEDVTPEADGYYGEGEEGDQEVDLSVLDDDQQSEE